VHLLLTDRLICPRCGPGFGLILMADRLENRRVIEGSLGCPNCRDRYPIQAGTGDLRPPPRRVLETVSGLEPPASPSAVEVAALLGLAEGGGSVALFGAVAGHAPALAAMVPAVEWIGVAAELRAWPPSEGVSQLLAGNPLPFSSASLRGVGLSVSRAPGERAIAAELARVVASTGRIVLWGVVREFEEALRSEGLDVLASEESAVVLGRKAS
jgi:uncharacterized protein YbaR (Trm112 family)